MVMRKVGFVILTLAFAVASPHAQTEAKAQNPKPKAQIQNPKAKTQSQSPKPKAESPKASGEMVSEFGSKTIDGQPNFQGIWGAGYAGMWTVNLEPNAYLRKLGMPPLPSGIQSAAGSTPVPMPIKPPRAAVIDPADGIL